MIFFSFILHYYLGIITFKVNSKLKSTHLARDAEEREQHSYLYLSLIEDSSVEEKDRNLILQSSRYRLIKR
jgi:hypothetical protein